MNFFGFGNGRRFGVLVPDHQLVADERQVLRKNGEQVDE
jgi:hypothetical protein